MLPDIILIDLEKSGFYQKAQYKEYERESR